MRHESILGTPGTFVPTAAALRRFFVAGPRVTMKVQPEETEMKAAALDIHAEPGDWPAKPTTDDVLSGTAIARLVFEF